MPRPARSAVETPGWTEKKRVFARWQFQYTNDLYVHRHQVFELVGARNDEKMLKMGYMELMKPGQRTFQAPNGGPHFISEEARDEYERERRRKEVRAGLPEDPVEEDARQARREKRLMEESPLRPQGGE